MNTIKKNQPSTCGHQIFNDENKNINKKFEKEKEQLTQLPPWFERSRANQ